ncbi:RHS repeat-associated core domain-containing protein [Terrisporobacter petrolearius]|uniref:RHS repeat-associated core domain-containing protein n=1 Tax=Terrisporobacter petrolearius TaxID=1460447 RepID=UPI0031CC4BDA
MCQVLVNVTNEAGLQTEVKDVGQDGTSPVAYDYDDFGVTRSIGDSTFFNEICYTGAIYDVSTGLYYLNARYYDPKNGRFITRDTYRGEINEPDTLHLYAYCANNPINYVDPSGHLRKTIFNKVTTVGIAISAILKLVCGIKAIMAKEALRKQIKYKGRSAILKVSKTKVKNIW